MLPAVSQVLATCESGDLIFLKTIDNRGNLHELADHGHDINYVEFILFTICLHESAQNLIKCIFAKYLRNCASMEALKYQYHQLQL